MRTFGEIYASETAGQITMFDRIIFKGHLSGLYPCERQFDWYLGQQGVQLKDYKGYAEQTTQELKRHMKQMAAEAGCEVKYLMTGKGPKGESKGEMAQQILSEKGGQQGLIVIFSTLEMKNSFTVRGDRERGHLKVVSEARKQLHYYLYYNDAEFGLMYVRVQSWWPFEVQIYINGHQWLAGQLAQAGVKYLLVDNAFWEIEDIAYAQKLCDKFAHRQWERVWNAFARQVNPFVGRVKAAVHKGYYWSIQQAEIATDVLFEQAETLNEVMPAIFEEVLLTFSADQVMRFLGRRLRGNFQGEIRTDLNKRLPGWRVKHWVKQNSVKMYNRGPVLRIETTINNSGEFKLPNEQPNSPRWKAMPKGVAHFWHFFQAGSQANHRYLQALAHLPFQGKAAQEALDRLCQSQYQDDKRFAKFQPVSEQDCLLFQAVLSADHLLNGFRNHHLVKLLFPTPAADPPDAKRRCTRISRLLAKLRGHQLIRKVDHAHLYHVTAYGYQVMAAALRFRQVDFPAFFQPA